MYLRLSSLRRLGSVIAFIFWAVCPVFAPSPVHAQYTWKNVTVPAGGYVSGINYSPVSQGLIYMRTDMGGAYRWDNAASLWVPLTDFLSDWNLYGIESIVPDPKNANNVYAAIGQTYSGGNGYILASANQGVTWGQYAIGCPIGGNNDGRNAGERLAVDPNLTGTNSTKLYFGSRSNGLWVSTNSAQTWTQVTAFPTNGDSGYGLNWVLFDPHGTTGTASQTIYVGVAGLSSGNSNLYRSVNGGTSWAVVSGGPTNMTTPHASLGTDGMLWINYDSGGYGPNGITTGQVWKLNTATLAWTNVTPAGGPAAGSGGYGGVCVDAQAVSHVVVSTMDWYSANDKMFSTTNAGASWVTIGNASTGWNGGPFSAYNNNGALWTRFCGANDGGVGWAGDIKIDPFDGNSAIYTTGGGIWWSKNINAAAQPAGVTWVFADYGLEETAQLDMTTSVAGGVLFSAMGDVAGMRHNNVTQSPALGMYCNPSMSSSDGIDFAQNATSIVVREGHSIWSTSAGGYSTDNGQNWITFGSNPNGYSTSSNNGLISVNANGTTVLWSLPSSNPVYSTLAGNTWNNTTGLPNGSFICSDRVNSSIFYGVSGTTLYVSANGGVTFGTAGTFAGGLSWNNRPRAVFGIAGEVWVPTGSGLYRFTNVGLGTVTTTKIANVTSATAVGFGKAATGYTHPAVYLVGTVSGTYGFFRCDDGVGTTWTRTNDAQHQFGGPGFTCGDEQVYGRQYLGTNGRGILYGDLTTASTPTFTFTATRTSTSTSTKTPTVTSTPTSTPTRTFSSTATVTSTSTATQTGAWTRTLTPTVTFTTTFSPTRTATLTATTTSTPTMSYTGTTSTTNTYTATNTPTKTSTSTFTSTVTLTTTSTPTVTKTATFTVTSSQTCTQTSSATNTSTSTSTATQTLTATATPSRTATKTSTPTPTWTSTLTATNTATPSHTPTVTNTGTNQPTHTHTITLTQTLSATNTSTPTSSPTQTPTATSSRTATATVTPTWTSTATLTNTATPSHTPTVTNTGTNLPTSTYTITSTPAETWTSTSTPTSTLSETPSSTPTETNTPTFPPTASATFSSTETSSPTVTNTGTQPPAATLTWTGTSTQTLTITSTATVSLTATNSETPTSTSTPTVSFTSTPSITFTATPTWTNTGTLTSTPVLTETATTTIIPVLTATATVGENCGHVVVSAPYPNPVRTGPVHVFVSSRCMQPLEVSIFSSAYRKIRQWKADVYGYKTVDWDLNDGKGRHVAAGLYYVSFTTQDGHRQVKPVVVLR